MLKSRLLYYFLLIALATIETWADHNADVSADLASTDATREIREEDCSLWKRVEHVVVERASEVEGVIFERALDLVNSPRERAHPAIGTPKPTPPPQKRQDDGQVQALSSQLRSLSESATQAISSVSSSASSAMSQVSQSAQSVRQSADQAIQSANQNADDANRQLSQTRSSASSAISASLSSMSSRISSNLASVQSSASSEISAAQAEASRSAANAVNIAASQIEDARADASGIRGDATSFVQQVQSNSVSGTNVAIIVSVAVVGTAFLSTLGSCLVVRYKRKKKRGREGEAAAGTVTPRLSEKPIAIRGSPLGTPRFTPFGGGTGYPMDKLKLPALSPLIKRKKVNGGGDIVGFATSDFTAESSNRDSDANVNSTPEPSFRFQKPKGIQKATSVRLIRVGSEKNKAREEDEQALIDHVPSPPSPVFQEPRIVPEPQPPQPRQQPISPPSPAPVEPVAPPEITQPPATQQSTAEPPQQRIPSIHDSTTLAPVRSTLNSQKRLRFRDSSDIESAEPTPIGWRQSLSASVGNTLTSMRNTNTASLRTTPDNNAAQQQPRWPKNAGASFATFPKVRNGPATGSIMSRARSSRPSPSDAASVDGEAASGVGSAGANSSNNGASAAAATANWPLIGS
ncbi:hypothetical protein F5X99DRAFT_122988 [Biscogniauxia marginata]|nr:hypothetical protein F5X99DRAFT_122988 [Biscogniauxia marginata]